MLMKCAKQLVVMKENRAKDENDDTKQAEGSIFIVVRKQNKFQKLRGIDEMVLRSYLFKKLINTAF